MSDEELERLAAEMKNIKATDTARKRGMDAAMAAFEAEHGSESVNQDNSQSVKNAALSQGSTDEARPTGQTTRKERGQTQRNGIMSKFTNIFTSNPRATMMLGSCAAALMFAVVIIPQTGEGIIDDGFSQVATEVASAPSSSSAKTDSQVPDTSLMLTRDGESAEIRLSDGGRANNAVRTPQMDSIAVPMAESEQSLSDTVNFQKKFDMAFIMIMKFILQIRLLATDLKLTNPIQWLRSKKNRSQHFLLMWIPPHTLSCGPLLIGVRFRILALSVLRKWSITSLIVMSRLAIPKSRSRLMSP